MIQPYSKPIHLLFVIATACTLIYFLLQWQLPNRSALRFQTLNRLRYQQWIPLSLSNGTDSNLEVAKKREHIKQMMARSWDNYKKYAWGANELAPISKRGRSDTVFDGFSSSGILGVTIVDGLDTLLLMGLNERYRTGRDWIDRHLSFDTIGHYVSVFEVTIRFIGSLISCYALTSDQMFLEKAVHIADRLLPAFESPTGLPYSWVKPKTGEASNYVWASPWWPWPYQHVLAEVGSLHLEFAYLSALTGNLVYVEKVEHVRRVLYEQMGKESLGGLYANFINPNTGQFGAYHVSLGASGDSFYEYLLKTWLQSDRQDNISWQMYRQAMDAVDRTLVQHSRSHLVYLADMKEGELQHQMGHLACFAGGMLLLGAASGVHDDSNRTEYFAKLGERLGETCHESYVRTKTGIGPERFWFTDNLDAQGKSENYYILRPEVIESWFYMWRFTKNPKYRQWAWDAVQAIEKYCLVPGGTGYSGISNVDSNETTQDDVQQSFWLAETLKYLYLIFSNDDLISLDKWIFNTEAHLLPIRNHNPAYPQ